MSYGFKRRRDNLYHYYQVWVWRFRVILWINKRVNGKPINIAIEFDYFPPRMNGRYY